MKHLFPGLYSIIICLPFLFFNSTVKAQDNTVTYFKKNGGRTVERDSAAYIRMLRNVRAETGPYELSDYYPNGNL